MSTISLFQFSALVLWPLLFSVCTLIWSERQSKSIEYLIRAKSSLRVLERDLTFEHETAHRLQDLNKELRSEARHHSHSLRQIKQGQRAKFLRLKGIPEEGQGNENTAEKVSELLEYLGFEIEASDIERANRVGGRDHEGPRAIVMELTSERLKHAILGEAAVKLRHTPYSILDDETFVVMEESQAMYVPDMGIGCGLISHVEDPELVKKSGRMFGFWGTDSQINSERVYIMEHFYKNAKVIQFENIHEFRQPTAKPKVFTMPYNWGGTGHLVINDCIYFNRFNTSNIVQYSTTEKKIVNEVEVRDAAFGNMAPYQWAGSTDFDLSYDECGLWLIYATLQNSLDIVISKLNMDTLEIETTHRTNWRKQWSGNAFMACGVLYVLKKYDEKYTSLNYIYNTHTDTYKYVDIPFTNKFEWNTMVDYNPRDKRIYAWDKGHQLIYNLTMESSDAL
ncbi:Oidioi.mRNA.OKI2018_I69.XSR.g14507.t1.cds [Oikopleura dioica]|uniref:Oidioi.mRNA.OKI2018_I69.XSR.g14507.t1.cds n=1 Tax=Oikopleura dioica TaxID=34765 RepID=A0ABN7SF85_OIKDI|nr:Oidioi.mRNA.OKI2018_I69.XSR.g14507.t1.cds [Oikopleura dioica]